MRQENSKVDPRITVNLDEILDALINLNKPMIDYLCLIRARGEAFISDDFGDYLVRIGAIQQIGKSEKYELTEGTKAWFESNTGIDPKVLSSTKVTLPTNILKSEPTSVSEPQDKSGHEKRNLITTPARCVLINAEGNPSKFGIVLKVEEGGIVEVSLPGENNKILRILLTKFDKPTVGDNTSYWKILSDSDRQYTEREEFDAYFKREKTIVFPEIDTNLPAEILTPLRDKFFPILKTCRETGDYRPLEREKLAANSEIAPLIREIIGDKVPTYLFYRDPRLPLSEGEQSILTARRYTATRCEELLEALNKKIALCRKLKDFSPLKLSNFRSDPDMLALAKYLSIHTKDGIISVYENKRVELTKDEIVQIQGDLTSSEVVKIKAEKWDPLLAKCRERNDFSPLLTHKLNKDPDLTRLLHYYGFPKAKTAKKILVEDLGLNKEELNKIVRVRYTFEFRQKIIREKILPIVLECIQNNNFSPLEFRTFIKDSDIYGLSISLLNRRPSVAGLLSHPEIGFSNEEAKVLVEGNRSNKMRVERENSLDDLREKTEALILTHAEAPEEG